MSAALAVVTRSFRLASLTLRYTFPFVFRPSRRPQLLHRYLESSGGGFIKLGQVLTVRYDLLPPQYCDALTDLLDHLPPAGFESIRAIIERELGHPLNEAFATFDPVPVSTASVAQVHRARILSGEEVAVKVIRPGADREMRADFAILAFAARLFRLLPLSSRFDLVGLVDELRELNREELDFRSEARNCAALRDVMSGDGVPHYAPAVYSSLSTRSVLTMEWLEGTSLREVLSAVARNDAAALARLAEIGIDPREVACTLFRSILTQCFTHRLFHADPHPGNILVLRDGRIGYVDFGMLGSIDEAAWSRQFRLNAAISREDIDAAYQVFLEALEPLPRHPLSLLEVTFKRRLQRWILAARYPSLDIAERSYVTFLRDVFDAVRREGLRMSWMDLRLNRTLMISDIVILALSPDLERLPLLRQYFSEAWRARRRSAVDAALQEEQWDAFVVQAASWPSLALAAQIFLSDRLPTLLRTYQSDESRLSSAVLLLLGYLRVASGLAALTLLIGPIVAAPLARAIAGQPWRWWTFAAALLTLLLSWRLIEVMEKE